MTDEEYMKQMVALTNELDRAASAQPYDPDEYTNIIDSINLLYRKWNRSRNRPLWILLLFKVAALLFFIGLLFLIFRHFFPEGSIS